VRTQRAASGVQRVERGPGVSIEEVTLSFDQITVVDSSSATFCWDLVSNQSC